MATTTLPNTVQRLIDGVIAREGGYVNNPADRGGATRYGITEGVARGHGYKGPMRDLPIALAIEIYRDIYYSGPGYDRLFAVMPRLAEELVDTSVNMGPTIGAQFLQRALNIFNRRGRDYPDSAVDGRIGPRTIANVLAFAKERGANAEKVLFRACDGLQRARYVEITEKREANEEFAFGWFLQRTGDLKEFAQ